MNKYINNYVNKIKYFNNKMKIYLKLNKLKNNLQIY